MTYTCGTDCTLLNKYRVQCKNIHVVVCIHIYIIHERTTMYLQINKLCAYYACVYAYMYLVHHQHIHIIICMYVLRICEACIS